MAEHHNLKGVEGRRSRQGARVAGRGGGGLGP